MHGKSEDKKAEVRYKLPDYIIVTRRKLHYYSVLTLSLASSLSLCVFLFLNRSFSLSILLGMKRSSFLCTQCQTNFKTKGKQWILCRATPNESTATGLTDTPSPSSSSSSSLLTSTTSYSIVLTWLDSHQTPMNPSIIYVYYHKMFNKTKKPSLLTRWILLVCVWETQCWPVRFLPECAVISPKNIITKCSVICVFHHTTNRRHCLKMTKRKTIFQLINFCSIDNRRTTKKGSTKALSK